MLNSGRLITPPPLSSHLPCGSLGLRKVLILPLPRIHEKNWQEFHLTGDWVMLRSVSQSTLITPKQQRNNASSWERRIFIKLGGFYGGLSCQLYIQLLLPSIGGTCVSKRQGKLVSLSIPLTWVITALLPGLLPSRRISVTGALGWEFQNEAIKAKVISAEIMFPSNAKPLRLAWIGFTPIWAHFVLGVI